MKVVEENLSRSHHERMKDNGFFSENRHYLSQMCRGSVFGELNNV